MAELFVEVAGWPLLLLLLIVFGAYTTQAITGFGSIIIALALAAHLYPVIELLPVLVALNVPLCLYFVLRHRQHLQGRLLLFEVLPWMAAGLGTGLLLFGLIRGQWLEQLFGLLVVVLAAWELWRARHPGGLPPPAHAPTMRASLGAAGVIHGLYASGGPLLVYALSRQRLSPAALRCSLMCVWLVFNATLVGVYAWRGMWTPQALMQTALLLPAIAPGIVLGEYLHARLSVRTFHLLIQMLLVVSGLALIIGTGGE